MGVYIKGIKPPKNCDECDWSWDCAHSEHMDGYEMLGDRPHNCPMVELPPHGRLIDGDIAEVISFRPSDAEGKDFIDGVLYAVDFISKMPTIIDAEANNEDVLYESLKRGLKEAIAYENGEIECRTETREDDDTWGEEVSHDV